MAPDHGTPSAAQAPVHVVAAVIADVRGRILLTRRTAGRDLAGLWEFPGGKLEPGESPPQALARELHEELGIDIDIDACEPLIRVPHAYAHKHIVLDVYRVGGIRGRPHGRERQAIAWSPPARLPHYPMPPADRPVLGALLMPPYYAITPEPGEDDADWLWLVQRLAGQGDALLQLRIKQAGERRRQALLQRACESLGAQRERILVNADIELARGAGTGVHLTAAQLAALERRPLPAGRLVAASCHDAAGLARAEALDVDFAVLSPVAATASHPDAVPIGWAGFARLRASCSLPVYGLGGLALGDFQAARRHGAQGIAGIGAFAAAQA